MSNTTLIYLCQILQSWSKIVWTTAKIGAVTDTKSNVQPI